MNKEDLDIIVAYIKSTICNEAGISRQSLDLLEIILMNDETIRAELLDMYNNITTKDGKSFFFLDPNYNQAHLQEHYSNLRKKLMKEKGLSYE